MDTRGRYPHRLIAPQQVRAAHALWEEPTLDNLSHSIDELWNEFSSDSNYMQSSQRIGTLVVA